MLARMRSHRKLAHRGSRIGLVHVSEPTVRRVLAEAGLVLEGPRPREPAPRTPWPDWLEWKPNRVWAYDFTHWSRPGGPLGKIRWRRSWVD
jgi:putative transposase